MMLFALGFFVCVVLVAVLNHLAPDLLNRILTILGTISALVAGAFGFVIEKL